MTEGNSAKFSLAAMRNAISMRHNVQGIDEALATSIANQKDIEKYVNIILSQTHYKRVEINLRQQLKDVGDQIKHFQFQREIYAGNEVEGHQYGDLQTIDNNIVECADELWQEICDFNEELEDTVCMLADLSEVSEEATFQDKPNAGRNKPAGFG